MSNENDAVFRKIYNSDDAIEMQVNIHCLMIAAAGEVPTEQHRQAFRKTLQSLAQLVRSEYILSVTRDMEQAAAALKG
jgi:hypothetical protein